MRQNLFISTIVFLMICMCGACKKDICISCKEQCIDGNDYLPNRCTLADNGRTDKTDSIIWDFSWPSVSSATSYHLYVKGHDAIYPIIDDTTILNNTYKFVSIGYIVSYNYDNWTWKVRAKINNQWTNWSPTIYFSVEPVNTD